MKVSDFIIDEDGFVLSAKSQKIDKQQFVSRLVLNDIDLLTDSELLQIPVGEVFTFDLECYYNLFYLAFKHKASGKFVTFELSPVSTINFEKLSWFLWRYLFVGFNINHYDWPLVELAFAGASTEGLKKASDFIIIGKNKRYMFEQEYELKVNTYNSIDLIEVAPLAGSLKLYAARIHCETIQDLPFPHDSELAENEAPVVRVYCCNDLKNTELLFDELAPEIKLRIELSQEYNLDLRSKSDAQIAEAVVNSEIGKLTGNWPKKNALKPGTTLKYSAPDFIKFRDNQLNAIFEIIKNTEFQLDEEGSPILPKEIEDFKITFGETNYNFQLGGLHSQEKSIAQVPEVYECLEDDDVESFYPRTILNQKLFPPHIGEAFLQVYEFLVNKRLDAKHSGKKSIADSLKIVINGLFGKLGNKYSTIYAPHLLLQVTLTGQLVLLMLIEKLNYHKIFVVSANTDGIITKYNRNLQMLKNKVIKDWEEVTGYKTERTSYAGLFSRDVNNYIAVKFDKNLDIGDCKVKGVYSEKGSALNSRLSKNPESLICSEAVQAYLTKKIPIEQTIKSCRNMQKFVCVRNVKGGGHKNGNYLGKVVRWYYAKGETGYIAYVESGNKVAKTDGATPLMTLPTHFVGNINYEYYIKKAEDMLYDIGAKSYPKTLSLF